MHLNPIERADKSILGLPPSLGVEIDGDIGVLRLKRAEKRNALDNATVLGLHKFFAAPPEGVKAVIIDGEGEHFSAGLDLSSLQEKSATEGVGHSMMWHEAFRHIQFGQVPVISVLHGAVIGGGLELAASTHIRVAEASAFYALPEGQRGIFVGGGGSVRIPRLIGAARMMDMMLTGRVYDAAEGHAIGLSQYLVEPGQGMAKALELAKKIATNAPMTNFAVMHALPRIVESNPESGYLMEAMMSSIAQADIEAKKRIRDFLEKRAAKVR
ncbi:crotonase/enoyl-CoA hydratase family protein [uncultured Ferrovibrio sp.]|jgi:enoyl-CoA hydratase/carnithine racemase|uniref:crotonase/enoyl-CoA hydratase family protein n=1 Tax=uncultured Ferrovibrio sp. TaxID=1576913 RepID=UPI0026104B61|nr:crotonase/enoyl-CoA hydratase family protein [uncultured Ferrovibrio sp.]